MLRNACIAMTRARWNLKLKRRMQSRYLSLPTACGGLEFALGEGDIHLKPPTHLNQPSPMSVGGER